MKEARFSLSLFTPWSKRLGGDMGHDKIARVTILPIFIPLLILSGCGEDLAKPEAPKPIKTDETLGQILLSIPMPPGSQPNGLAWDGDSLWVSSYMRRSGLHRVDPDMGEVFGPYNFADTGERVDYSGLTSCPGYLWVALSNGGPIYKLDLSTFKAVHSIPSPFPPNKAGNSRIEDLAWDGEALWVAGVGGSGHEIRRVNPENGSTLACFRIEGGLGGPAVGLAYGGGYLWLASGGKIRKIDPQNFETLLEFPIRSGMEGLAYVNGYLWAASFSEGMIHRISLAPLRRKRIYVDEGNRGLEDGSRAHPYNTIQEGISAAEYGDDVVVAAGTYQGGLRLREGIDLIGSGVDETIILLPPNEMIKAIKANDITISGFTIICQGERRESFWSAIWCEESKNVRISNNIITMTDTYMSGAGILIRESPKAVISNNIIIGGFFHGILSWNRTLDGSRGARVENNTISQAYEAVHCSSSSPFLKDNTIVQNKEGVHCYSSSPKLEGNRIINNEIGVRCRVRSNPDLGGGEGGSRGHNSIYNSRLDVYNETDNTIKAENNWWGQPDPDPSRFSGPVNYIPFLKREARN